MCGASSQQTQIEASQADFYKTLTDEYKTVFGKNQAILDSLTTTFKPILEAGPNQRGFSDEERNTLNTQATEAVARDYSGAAKAVNENIAAQGGGDEVLPSGEANQRKQEVANASAGEQSGMQNKIIEEDYATGRQNFNEAAQVLGATASQYSPTGYAGAATGAGSAASQTANEIAQEDNSWMSAVSGAAGGILGGLAGNPGLFGGGKRN